MDKRELKIDYVVWKNSFPEGYEELCQRAIQASQKAYAVYSGFSVGAAVLLEGGEIVVGNNQENGAYPSGMCAERTALFYAGAVYPEKRIKAVAIVAYDRNGMIENALTPCGACRQVMAELIKRHAVDFDLVLMGKKESMVVSASALLPFPFGG